MTDKVDTGAKSSNFYIISSVAGDKVVKVHTELLKAVYVVFMLVGHDSLINLLAQSPLFFLPS